MRRIVTRVAWAVCMSARMSVCVFACLSVDDEHEPSENG